MRHGERKPAVSRFLRERGKAPISERFLAHVAGKVDGLEQGLRAELPRMVRLHGESQAVAFAVLALLDVTPDRTALLQALRTRFAQMRALEDIPPALAGRDEGAAQILAAIEQPASATSANKGH